MKIRDFRLERFFAKYEFAAPYLMGSSDCESFTVREILALEPGAEELLHDLWLGYTESQGDPRLRAAISGLYARVGPEGILVHAGAEEAIFNFMNVTLQPGDHAIVQFPCYQSLFEVASAMGCEVSKWELKQGQHGWEVDLAALQQAVRDNTRVIVLNTPHNPTGYVLTREELETILGLARERQILVFADEVYKDLEYEQEAKLPPICDLYENAVSLGVMSKAYGLPGLRIGWIATQNRQLYEEMAAFKDYTTICNSAPGELLALIALRNREYLLERNMGIIKDNLALLDAFFARYPHLFTWNRPKAGPIAFPGLKVNRPLAEVAEDLIRKKGVMVVPGNMYGFYDSYFRVGYGRKNLGECLRRFEEYVNQELVPSIPGNGR